MKYYLNSILSTRYLKDKVSFGQFIRFSNLIEDSLDLLSDSIMNSEIIKSDMFDELGVYENVKIDSVFVENLYQEVLGFRVNLITIYHMGLYKKVVKTETNEILGIVVLMDGELNEN